MKITKENIVIFTFMLLASSQFANAETMNLKDIGYYARSWHAMVLPTDGFEAWINHDLPNSRKVKVPLYYDITSDWENSGYVTSIMNTISDENEIKFLNLYDLYRNSLENIDSSELKKMIDKYGLTKLDIKFDTYFERRNFKLSGEAYRHYLSGYPREALKCQITIDYRSEVLIKLENMFNSVDYEVHSFDKNIPFDSEKAFSDIEDLDDYLESHIDDCKDALDPPIYRDSLVQNALDSLNNYLGSEFRRLNNKLKANHQQKRKQVSLINKLRKSFKPKE